MPGSTGLGLCDRNSVAGVVRAHLIKREQKLPLRYHPGARLVFADGTPDILAYPRDRQGWGQLCRLLTRGNLRAEKGDCILYLDDLLDHVDGLELVVMEASTWELPSPPFLRKPPSAPASAALAQERPTAASGETGHGNGKPGDIAGSKKAEEAARLRLIENTQEKAGTKTGHLLSLLRAAAPGRVRLAADMLYRGNDRARLARRAGLARAGRCAAHRRQRRALSSPRPAGIAGRAHLHPRAPDDRHGRPSACGQCRALSQAARRDGASFP